MAPTSCSGLPPFYFPAGVPKLFWIERSTTCTWVWYPKLFRSSYRQCSWYFNLKILVILVLIWGCFWRFRLTDWRFTKQKIMLWNSDLMNKIVQYLVMNHFMLWLFCCQRFCIASVKGSHSISTPKFTWSTNFAKFSSIWLWRKCVYPLSGQCSAWALV